MAIESTAHAYVVLDGAGKVEVVLLGVDAGEAAAWYAELGFRIVEAELATSLAAA